MPRTLLWFFSSLLASQVANAALPDGRLNANQIRRPVVPLVRFPTGPVKGSDGSELPSLDTTYYFEQLIDHNNPSLGTFQQRYWHTAQHYKSGGPIILTTPGEVNADGYQGYLTNATINGLIAQRHHAATIVLEHRFYGFSNPYPDLSVQSFQVHTIQQAIEDLVYFAQNVVLPMPDGDNVKPDTTPWILIGGSYAGALTSWTMVNKPGIFWAGYSSSGVVQAITDYYDYFTPIRENMPQNCSADVEAVIAYVDAVLTSDNTTAIDELKTLFGMGDMSHLDDFAGALRNNLWDWQSLQPSSGPGTSFYNFCDALEVQMGVSAPASGWGLINALQAWGSYWSQTYFGQLCGSLSVEDCFGTYDLTQSYWTDTTIDNAQRSWSWIVCNEVGFLQDGPPDGVPAIVSRLVQPIYDERQCQQMFPEAFSSPPVPNADNTNAIYQGWDVSVDRLFFANGLRDPWREATVSTDSFSKPSTPRQPIFVGNGFHCSDLGTSSGVVDRTIGAVQKQALSYMKTWLAEWQSHISQVRRRQNEPEVVANAKPVSAWMRGVGVL